MNSTICHRDLRAVSPLAAACLAGVVALGALAGCQTARVEDPVTARYTGDTFESEMSFWHTLPTQPAVSNADTVRALLGVLAGESGGDSYEERIETLKQRGWLDEGFDKPASDAATRGTIATIVASALGIEGGVMMRIVGPMPRYATRELHYLNLYPDATSPNQTISGGDLLGLLGRVESYRRQHQVAVATPQPLKQVPRVEPAGQPVPQPEQ